MNKEEIRVAIHKLCHFINMQAAANRLHYLETGEVRLPISLEAGHLENMDAIRKAIYANNR